MKRLYLMAVATFMSVAAWAQNIAVVSPGNSTNVYQTLDDAIAGATPGSTIYLPGGGFQIKNETLIDKKLTIMGVSHRGDTDNVDGATSIAGNLNFVGGSSGSAVLGTYISGNIIVGTETDSVLNLTVRYCNANSIQVRHSQSSGMVVNQCYLRNGSNFAYCNVRLENNILHSLSRVNGGTINHNVIVSASNFGMGYYSHGYFDYSLIGIDNSTVSNNFLLPGNGPRSDEYNHNSVFVYNCPFGDNPISLDEGQTFDDIFRANKGVSFLSDYRLNNNLDKSKFIGSDGTVIGIEGGSGFNPDALAPIPRIVSKKVDEQTDGSGKLKVEVKVKAN